MEDIIQNTEEKMMLTIESLEISTPKEETISLNFCFINSSNSIYISPNRSVELTAHHLRYRKIS